jgi:hypothetical protein
MARRWVPARTGMAVAVCASAALLWLSGCSSGSLLPKPTPSSTSSSPSPASSVSQPSWAAALGSGVTVDPPGTVLSGHGSPGSVVQAVLETESTSGLAASCPYYTPSFQSECRQLAAKASGSGETDTVKNFHLGYVAVDGDRALVGFTATICLSGRGCVTNSDPAAVFSSGESFSALWPQEIAAMNSPTFAYSLANCVKVGDAWYNYPPTP